MTTRKSTIITPSDTILVFSTIPSNTTKDVKLEIPPGKIWHIYRGKEGIILVDRTKEKRERDTYLLSNLQDEDVAEDTALKIDPRCGAFNVQYSRGRFGYSFRNSEYLPLPYAKSFMESGLHKFKCGTLEFTLELQKKSQLKQLDLFARS